VGITLVPYIPDDLVPWAVEYPVQGDRKLDYTQTGGQMSTSFRHCIYQLSSHLFSELA